MSQTDLILICSLGMVAGLVGVLVPVLPGLLLMAGTAVLWAAFDDAGFGRWVVLALVLAVLAAGTVAKYAVPARSLKGVGAPRRTLLLGVLGAVVGVFVIPIAGIVIGFVLGIFAAEWSRLGNAGSGWRSTWATLKGIGIGVLLEFSAGVLALLVWALGLIALHA